MIPPPAKCIRSTEPSEHIGQELETPTGPTKKLASTAAHPQRRQAGTGRIDDRCIWLPKLAANAVDVQMIHSSKSPQLLKRLKGEPELRAASERAPAVAMAVDR